MLKISDYAKEQIDILRNSDNIVGLSGGKDSVATCIFMRRLDIPFRTVTAEVWWKDGITGENPKHYDFVHDTLVPKLNRWGVRCDFIKSEITAYECMTTPIVKSKYPERIGKYRGFPLCGRCSIQRDCKMHPCKRYYKAQTQDYNVIAGIAADEEKRMVSNTANNRISILGLLGIAEYETYGICIGENLLSPTYGFSDRGGCWFCPNQKIQELELLYREYPKLWSELMEIQKMPNKVTEKFNRTQTLYDIEDQIRHGVQIKFFMGDIYGRFETVQRDA